MMGERAMPAPDCIGQGELDPGAIDFGRPGRRVVEGRFDGSSWTRNGSVMLPSAADRKLGVIEAASRCIADPRSALRITHAVRDMLRQRVHGLALGWDDLDDHKALRCSVAMQTAVGVDREAPANPRWAGWRTGPAVLRMCGCTKCYWSNSSPASRPHPGELVPVFDATVDPLHSQQERRFFHACCDDYCCLSCA